MNFNASSAEIELAIVLKKFEESRITVDLLNTRIEQLLNEKCVLQEINDANCAALSEWFIIIIFKYNQFKTLSLG